MAAKKKAAKKKTPSEATLRRKKKDLDIREDWLKRREKELDAYEEREEAAYARQRADHESWLKQCTDERQKIRDESSALREESQMLKKEQEALKAEIAAKRATLEAGEAVKSLMKLLYHTVTELEEEAYKNGRGPGGWTMTPWGPMRVMGGW